MLLYLNLFAALLLVVTLTSLVVAFLVLRRPSMAGRSWLFLQSIAGGVWAFAAAMETLSVSLEDKLFWSKLEYAGTLSIVMLALRFVAAYLHRDNWLRPVISKLIWIIPGISFALVLTNEYHGWLWNEFTPILGTNQYIYGHGFLFWVIVAYNYFVALIIVGLLLNAMRTLHGVYRSQTIVFLGGALAPLTTSVLYVLDWEPIRGLDFTPIGFMGTNLLFFLATYRFGLFRLSPVARHAVIENLTDGVIVLDDHNIIADINPSALALLELGNTPPLGKLLDEVLADSPILLRVLRDTESGQVDIHWKKDPPRILELHISPVSGGTPNIAGRAITLRNITGRRLMEEALRKSETTLRRLIENMLDVITETDGQGRVTYITPSVRGVLGYSPEALLGRGFDQIVHPDDSAFMVKAVRRHYEIAKAGGESMGKFEFRVFRADGSICHVEAVSRSILDETNHFVTAVTVNRDVTARKLAEEALAKSEQHFRSYFERAMVGMLATGSDDRLLEANEAMSHILGYSVEELKHMTITQLSHPDDIALDRMQYNRIQAGEIDGYSLEKRFIRKDGNIVHAIMGVQAVRKPDGSLDYIVGLVEDITERKRMDMALQESEHKYRTLIENIHDVIWEMSSDLVFTYISPTDVMQRGYRPEEVIGRPLWDFLTSESVGSVKDTIAAHDVHLKTGRKIESTVFVIEQIRKDGGTIWTEVVLNPIYDANEQLTSYQGVSRDITDRKQAEDALHDTVIELEAFNSFMVGREKRMIELKEEINRLQKELGRPPKYEVPR